MKKNQLRYNRINILFSLTVILLAPFISKAQLKVNASGNVIIGTTTTTTPLDVKGLLTSGSASLLLRNGDQDDGALGRIQIRFGYGNLDQYQSYIRTRHNSIAGGGPTDNAIDFYTGNGTATGVFPTTAVLGLTINNGRIGIGQLYPQGKLHIKDGGYRKGLVFERLGTTALRGYQYIGDGTNSTVADQIYFDAINTGFHFRQGGAGTTETVTFTVDGNVGIGIINPTYDLQLVANSAAKPTTSTWTVTSDIRAKKNIASYGHGLDLVRQVKIVTYQYNGLANTPDGENGIGVIAQDFQKVFPNSVKSFTIKKDSTTSESFLGVDFHELFVANVGAVKELDSIVSTQNKALKAKVDSLITKLTEVQNQIKNLTSNVNTCCGYGTAKSGIETTTITDVTLNNSQTIVLEQNVPNPFAEQTTINYFLPDNTAKAQMLFYNAGGILIQSVDLIHAGKGTLNVFAQDLTNGIYSYTLVVEGKIIETKKMAKQ